MLYDRRDFSIMERLRFSMRGMSRRFISFFSPASVWKEPTAASNVPDGASGLCRHEALIAELPLMAVKRDYRRSTPRRARAKLASSGCYDPARRNRKGPSTRTFQNGVGGGRPPGVPEGGSEADRSCPKSTKLPERRPGLIVQMRTKATGPGLMWGLRWEYCC